jgi:hypothetical protein
VARCPRRAGRAHLGGRRRAGAGRPRTELCEASASQSRGHDPDDVHEAGAVDARRGGDGRLPDGQLMDRRRPLAMRGEDPPAL